MRKKFHIVCLGELLMDMFSETVPTPAGKVTAYLAKPGGAPANVAVAARRLGLRSAFIGKVGRDHFGEVLRDTLQEEGVDTRGIGYADQARTTLAIITAAGDQDPQFTFYRNPGADQQLQAQDLPLDLLQAAEVLHVGSLSLSDEPARGAAYRAVEIAREAGALISYDVNYRPKIWKDSGEALRQSLRMVGEAGLVKLNQAEACLLTGEREASGLDLAGLEESARQLLALGPGLIVITLGSTGSYFQTRQGGRWVAPFPVETVDVVGCGDAFLAGLLCQLLAQAGNPAELAPDRLAECLRFANAVGALTALKKGAIPALPTLQQVEQFLALQAEGG